ncbi:MAG TPA: metallophosphoesterase family protein [Bryobacteraceae bacterium]|nr:metallophosphoesterase family protein [Bryobacteraceae bacterium]
MRIGLISDTHAYLDPQVFQYFEQCQEIWHGGDFGALGVLEHLEAFRPTRGVFGNIDGPDVRFRVPEDLEWDCEGVRVYMTHIGGYPGRYDKRAKREIERRRPGLFICGHSHVARVMRDPRLQLLHMNPGAAGNSGWHTMRTIMRFTIEAGDIGGVELIELGPRGKTMS